MPLKVESVSSVEVDIVEDAPAWLNVALLNDLLQKNIKDFQKIVKFVCKSLSEKEEVKNLHISVQMQMRDGKSRRVCYLLQVPMLTKSIKTLTNTSSLFKKAYIMHYELLPAFEALYEAANQHIQFAATPHQLRSANNMLVIDYILLDDLETKGFRNGRGGEGFDLQHMEQTLAKLAAFHAASAVYYEQNRATLQIFAASKSSASKAPRERNELIQRKFVEALRWYDLREFQDKLKSYQAALATPHSSDKFEGSDFNVLQHGSCWPNNIYFHEDAFRHAKQVLFANFGNAEYGSPAKDLLYLLLTAPRTADKLKYFDYYVKYYHDELIAKLQLLKYKKTLPTLTSLHLAIMNCSWWAHEAITKILPFVLLEELKQHIDIAEILTGHKALDVDLVNKAFDNAAYAQQIKLLLPWMENRAFLEEY